jgi:hypothetical protein
MGAAGHWMQFTDALEVDAGADEVSRAAMHWKEAQAVHDLR